MNERLKDKYLTVSLTDEAKAYIIDQAYDEHYGARPIKRYVTGAIETLIATAIIEGAIKPNTTITIAIKDQQFQLQVSK